MGPGFRAEGPSDGHLELLHRLDVRPQHRRLLHELLAPRPPPRPPDDVLRDQKRSFRARRDALERDLQRFADENAQLSQRERFGESPRHRAIVDVGQVIPPSLEGVSKSSISLR